MQVNPLISFSLKERALLKEIVTLFFQSYNGFNNRAVSQDILTTLQGRGHKVNDASFREYLGFIRRNESCRKFLKKYFHRNDWAFIVSSNEGYWWTEDLSEMKAFWQSQHGRVCEIMMNVGPLYKLFGWSEEQLKLILEDNDKKAA